MTNRSIADSTAILSSPVAQGLAVIGDRWAFLIIRDIYLGINRFEGLKKSTGGARGTVASRLKSLQERGILDKVAYQQTPPRYEYRLTEMGLGLYPMVLMIWRWDHRWGKRDYLPEALRHQVCGQSMVPVLRCRTCQMEVQPTDTQFEFAQDYVSAAKIPARYQRRTKSPRERSGQLDQTDISALDCVGDRWTSLVVAAAFFGLRRFDDIATAIGIATNILSDRLRLLVDTGIFTRQKYQERPVRFEYRFSDKGRDLYPQTIAIHQWANRWILDDGTSPLQLIHRPCGSTLISEISCGSCSETLKPREVDYQPTKAAGESETRRPA